MRHTKKKPIEYVNNKTFYEAIIDYRKACDDAKAADKQEPRMPNYIGECIMKIANRLSTHPWFVNYSFRDEMISDGVENCFVYFHSFDPNKSNNPFAYFTQVIYFAFRRRILKEEKNRYIIYKNFQENVSSVYDSNLFRDGENNHLMPPQLYDNINDFVDKFEKKEEVKKQKRKQTKDGLHVFFIEEKENEEQTDTK
jgi:hypothetical protein